MDFVPPKPVVILSHPCVCDSCGTWPLSPEKRHVQGDYSTDVQAREEVESGNTCSLPTPHLTSSLTRAMGQRTQFPTMDVQQSIAGSVVNVTHSGLSDHVVRVSRLKALASGQLENECKTEHGEKRWEALCPQCRGALVDHFGAQVSSLRREEAILKGILASLAAEEENQEAKKGGSELSDDGDDLGGAMEVIGIEAATLDIRIHKLLEERLKMTDEEEELWKEADRLEVKCLESVDKVASFILKARHLAIKTGALSRGNLLQALFTFSESGGLPCINGSRISRFPDKAASLSGEELERAWAQAVLLLYVAGKTIDGGQSNLDKTWRLVPLVTAARVIDLSETPPVIHILSFSPPSDVNGVETDKAIHAFSRCAYAIQLLALEKRRKEDDPPPHSFDSSIVALENMLTTCSRGPKEWEVWVKCIADSLDWLISSFS